MQVTVHVNEMEPGQWLRLSWDPRAFIRVVAGEEVVISCNRPGLLTLARHLLTLAQDGLAPGTHVHLDETNGLEPGSSDTILEFVDDDQ